MKYGYIRVSTRGQERNGNSLESQTKLLIDNGVEECNIYKDVYSGKTGKAQERINLQRLLNLLKAGDTLLVTKPDRFARSLIEGAQIAQKLVDNGVILHILNIGIMDNSPTGRLILNIFFIFFSFAEFERDMIVERTQERKAIAREKPEYKEGRFIRITKFITVSLL